MDADRRDWTNASGYIVPTETEAIRNLTNEEKATQTARNSSVEMMILKILIFFTTQLFLLEVTILLILSFFRSLSPSWSSAAFSR